MLFRSDPVGPEGRERVDATSLLSYALKLRRDMVDGDGNVTGRRVRDGQGFFTYGMRA